jgi:hypothetical protein
MPTQGTHVSPHAATRTTQSSRQQQQQRNVLSHLAHHKKQQPAAADAQHRARMQARKRVFITALLLQ